MNIKNIRIMLALVIAVILMPLFVGMFVPAASKYLFIPINIIYCCVVATPLYYQYKYSLPMAISKEKLNEIQGTPNKLQRYMLIERVASVLALMSFVLTFGARFAKQ